MILGVFLLLLMISPVTHAGPLGERMLDQIPHTHGILIMTDHQSDGWKEIIAPPDKCTEYTEHVIEIKYWSNRAGVMSIQLLEKTQCATDTHLAILPIHFGLNLNTNSVRIPITPFCHGLVIRSSVPILLNRVEVIPDFDFENTIGLDFYSKLTTYFLHLTSSYYIRSISPLPLLFNYSPNPNDLFKSAYACIMALSPADFYGPLTFLASHRKEISVKSFLTLMVQFFDPAHNIFYFTDTHQLHIKHDAFRCLDFHSQNRARFMGRVVGLSMLYQQNVEVTLSIALLNYVVSKKTSIEDMYLLDPPLYKWLEFILNHDVDSLQLTMSDTRELNGEVFIVDLVPDGRHVLVTNDNKREFVDLLIEQRYVKSDQVSATAFRSGVLDVLRKEYLEPFDGHELQILIRGRTDIDVHHWRLSTRYLKEYTYSHQIVSWFWQCVASWNNEQRRQLLHFVSGSYQYPAAGFGELSLTGFTIVPHSGHNRTADSVVPCADVQLNRLYLPPYSTYETLVKRLEQVIRP